MHTADFQTAHMWNLLRVGTTPCISIYLPTHKRGMETKQNGIRFKNQLRRCRELLQKHGLSEVEAKALLRPGTDALADAPFWKHLQRGLAFFMAPDFFRALILPIECREHVHIGTQFYIKPLVSLLNTENRFFLLALSRGQAKLYEADRWGMEEIAIPEAPPDLETFLQYDETQEHVQRHTTPIGKTDGSASMFHGQGNVADERAHKRRVDEYVKAVKNAVEKHIGADGRPLVLVAPEYVQAVYRDTSRYHHLLDESIQRTPDPLSESELYEAVQGVVRPHFEQIARDRLGNYQDLLATEHASDRIEQIISAAQQGRVQTLLVDPTVSDTKSSRVSFESGEEPLNLAVRHTLTHGGDVYAVDRQAMPSRSPAGAIFRY